MHKTNFETLQSYLESQIIGQHDLVKQLLIALLADGHILVEGPPGLAKTRAVKSLSDCVEGDFHRIHPSSQCFSRQKEVLVFKANFP